MDYKFLIDGFAFEKSTIIPYLLLMLVTYLLLIRTLLKSYMVRQRKMTKKERKAYDREKWSRTRKENLLAFGKWLLCKCYSEDQKGIFFIPFVVISIIYLSLLIVFILFGVLAFFFSDCLEICRFVAWLSTMFIHIPLGLLIIVFVIYGGIK